MKNVQKLLAAAMAFVLALSLTSCGKASNPYSLAKTCAGLDGSATMVTVNGEEVSTDLYLYWLAYDTYYWSYMTNYYYGTQLDFTQTTDDAGTTMADYLKDDARNIVVRYTILHQKALSEKCDLTDDQKKEFEEKMDSYKKSLGSSGSSYEDVLKSYGINSDTFEFVNKCSLGYYYDNLEAKLVTDPTDEDMDTYISDNDLYLAKHILLRTTEEDVTNDDGSVTTADDYNKKAKETAEDLLAQIKASSDPLTTFDDLMNQYSEDTGLQNYPDGYSFTSGDMDENFETAVKALDFNEVSDIVTTSYGYHIILRLDPDTDELREKYKDAKMDEQLQSWIDAADVTTADAYDSLDTEAFYTAYTDYQNKLNGSATASPSPSASVAPTESAAAEASASPTTTASN